MLPPLSHLSPHYSGPAVIQNWSTVRVLESHLDNEDNGPCIVCGLLIKTTCTKLKHSSFRQIQKAKMERIYTCSLV